MDSSKQASSTPKSSRPRAQTAWRRKENHDADLVSDYKREYDEEWPDGLADEFDTVVLDEHILLFLII